MRAATTEGRPVSPRLAATTGNRAGDYRQCRGALPSMCYMFVDYSLCLSGTELPVLLSASVLLGLVLAQNIRERLMTDHHRRTAPC
jgi:hypothetical protein